MDRWTGCLAGWVRGGCGLVRHMWTSESREEVTGGWQRVGAVGRMDGRRPVAEGRMDRWMGRWEAGWWTGARVGLRMDRWTVDGWWVRG